MARIVNIKRPWIAESKQDRNNVHDPFYDSPAWRKLRKAVLREEPLCRECKKEGVIKAATVVDHIEPLKLRPDLALFKPNLQPMCNSHHAKKSANERTKG